MKVAFVTGASRGIGWAIAEELAAAGYHLALAARSRELLMERGRELKEKYHITCLCLPGDVGSPEFVEGAFAQVRKSLGQVDVLVNNAGISYIGLLSEMGVEQWNQIIATNLTSVFLCCRQAIPLMVARKQGRIINISSVWGEAGASCEAAYSATKGGVNALTKALGKELAPSGIAVNAIACGMIDTEMNQCFSQEERKALMEEIPAGRFAVPKEVAQMVNTLAEAPAYLTGQVVTMDGGWI